MYSEAELIGVLEVRVGLFLAWAVHGVLMSPAVHPALRLSLLRSYSSCAILQACFRRKSCCGIVRCISLPILHGAPSSTLAFSSLRFSTVVARSSKLCMPNTSVRCVVTSWWIEWSCRSLMSLSRAVPIPRRYTPVTARAVAFLWWGRAHAACGHEHEKAKVCVPCARMPCSCCFLLVTMPKMRSPWAVLIKKRH